MNTSQVGRDELVFLKVGNPDPWYINIAAIVRLFNLEKKSCDRLDYSYPTVGIDMVGRQEPIYITGCTAEDINKRINKAIKDHYDSIANSELLGQ